MQQDGSFRYGYYPRFDRVIPGYNCMRHASTIWSLLCQYRITQKASVLSLAARSIDYLLSHALVYRDPDTAYLSEPLKDEIKLGGGGVLILAITEYLDLCSEEPRPAILRSGEPCSEILRSEEPRPAILRSREPLTKAPNAEILHAKDVLPEQETLRRRYTEIACALGNGILSLLNPETGEFSHVLNMDFSLKERYRTVYYDGEAAYALCRLYRLTKEEKWLFYAGKAVNHFLAADYTRYRDHWVAYAMNEITRYIHRDDYDTFALRNARVNLDFLYKRETTYHTFLELLMVTFETYERILAENPGLPYLKEFDLPYFLRTIRVRADRMLNGFFFRNTPCTCAARTKFWAPSWCGTMASACGSTTYSTTSAASICTIKITAASSHLACQRTFPAKKTEPAPPGVPCCGFTTLERKKPVNNTERLCRISLSRNHVISLRMIS